MGEEQKTEHKLTDAEIRRAELLKQREEKLFAEGYQRKDLTISIDKANTTGLLYPLPIAAIIAVLFFVLNGINDTINVIKDDTVLWFIGLLIFAVSGVVLAVVHEGIHAIFWAMGTENHFKDIEFGFIKEKITPYCTSKAPLSKRMYILGSLMPMTIIGIGFGVAGIISGNFLMFIIGICQIFAGAGDLLVSCMLLRYKSKGKDMIIMDHPTEVGLIIYEK
ncbi:MAG: DUF3267 domain-containing protein [Lachnospiraceae bacterium]|nr:DUF3267 domain-containing protein [Lachnospiraceae bacterium]